MFSNNNIIYSLLKYGTNNKNIRANKYVNFDIYNDEIIYQISTVVNCDKEVRIFLFNLLENI